MKPFALLLVVLTLIAPGCKKKPKPVDDGNSQSAAGGGGIIVSGAGGGIVTDPGAVIGGGGGGGSSGGSVFGGGGGGSGGAVQSTRKAVARLKDGLAEFKNLGLVIQMLMDRDGRMPTKADIVAELKQYPTMLKAVNDGAVVLTGTREPGGLWAYEVDAESIGGVILVGGTTTRATADEVKQYIAALPADIRAKLPTAAPQEQPQQGKTKAPVANVTRQDMEEIRIFIDNVSGVSGQMPSQQQVVAALTQAQSPAAELVKQGVIVINPARTRGEVWAYEAKALQQGGWVVGSNGVEQLNAAELKRRLGR